MATRYLRRAILDRDTGEFIDWDTDPIEIPDADASFRVSAIRAQPDDKRRVYVAIQNSTGTKLYRYTDEDGLDVVYTDGTSIGDDAELKAIWCQPDSTKVYFIKGPKDTVNLGGNATGSVFSSDDGVTFAEMPVQPAFEGGPSFEETNGEWVWLLTGPAPYYPARTEGEDNNETGGPMDIFGAGNAIFVVYSYHGRSTTDGNILNKFPTHHTGSMISVYSQSAGIWTSVPTPFNVKTKAYPGTFGGGQFRPTIANSVPFNNYGPYIHTWQTGSDESYLISSNLSVLKNNWPHHKQMLNVPPGVGGAFYDDSGISAIMEILAGGGGEGLVHRFSGIYDLAPSRLAIQWNDANLAALGRAGVSIHGFLPWMAGVNTAGTFRMSIDRASTWMNVVPITGLNVLGVGFVQLIADGVQEPNDPPADLTRAEGILEFDTPVAFWKLDELNGAVTAVDSSGNGRNGTYQGAADIDLPGTLKDTGNKAVFFSGGGKVAIPDFNFLGVNGAFSIETWINLSALASESTIIFSKANPANGNPNPAVLAISDLGRIKLWIGDGTNGNSSYYDSADGTVVAGQWYHLVVTFTNMRAADNAPQATFYLNGRFLGEETFGGAPLAVNSNNAISIAGAQSASIEGQTINHFNGKIDEVIVYDYELSSETVAQHYLAGSATQIDQMVLEAVVVR